MGELSSKPNLRGDSGMPTQIALIVVIGLEVKEKGENYFFLKGAYRNIVLNAGQLSLLILSPALSVCYDSCAAAPPR